MSATPGSSSGAPPALQPAAEGRSGLRQRWSGLSEHDQVGVTLAGMGGAIVLWALLWPVPTEVIGMGVLIYPNNAGVLNARAGGQVKTVTVHTGYRVRKGQVLLKLYLPVLEKQLAQQRGNLAQLERHNEELNARDRLRLDSEKTALDTALAKLSDDARRYTDLQSTYSTKLRNLDWLAKKQVVAPLSSSVVTAQEKNLLTNYQQVKLTIETQALQRRYQIDDLKRQINVTEAQIAYDGTVTAERDGTVLDLQVIPGQTVSTGQRLGTIGRPATPQQGDQPLKAVAYFAPADARRLPTGLEVEVVPEWNQRGRFGGIIGRITQVLALPATSDDISTTVGNPQLASELTKNGPVMRAEVELARDRRSADGFRWTLSGGSGVFPVRDGLTVSTHAYVEWRTPITYVIPGLRSLTGGYRSLRIDRLWDRPALRQPGTLP
jgi:HlyD family secretion protein